ncbi:hypothetical protein [Tenuibacillus multivorans]|uniref:Fur-regulated basic protein B n=1 Tax=Tenuibacillus multivorans TaxID=237069 RepID=A0A1G9XS14_9BACI|nr:hypothetical protein [Tenuibacillus multivorans]GEL75781.1 hypothetical protein TMU01_00160 [Tenuibacillus multivorans]SDM99206.1 hypothetical protein SAMN05216498_1074 [Tenuibacillus multivorans]
MKKHKRKPKTFEDKLNEFLKISGQKQKEIKKNRKRYLEGKKPSFYKFKN